jgi:hypothetical protein
MALSGCRTYHRMACAIEDAEFITHPMFCGHGASNFRGSGRGRRLCREHPVPVMKVRKFFCGQATASLPPDSQDWDQANACSFLASRVSSLSPLNEIRRV